MNSTKLTLLQIESAEHRHAARLLDTEYLTWIADMAKAHYGLSFDIEAMVRSDIDDSAKFYPPTGRFYLVEYEGVYVGIGCLKRLAGVIGEIQRMYIQPHIRGIGAGRVLLKHLLRDARLLGYMKVRLESLKLLSAAHSLYHSEGFVNIDPYSENSMKAYQPPQTLGAYRDSAVFMEIDLSEP